MITDRLYYDDAYLREFDARVVALRPEGWAAWAVEMMDGRLAIGVRRKAVAYLLYLSYSACFFLSPRM